MVGYTLINLFIFVNLLFVIMKFSTRATYGLRAMINLAQNKQKDSISLSNISKKENISLGYLEKIFSILKKERIVKSAKGVNGGYSLNRKSEDIDVYSILKVLEGDGSTFHCVDKNEKVYCSKKCDCRVEPSLAKIENAVNSSLKKIKLSDLI